MICAKCTHIYIYIARESGIVHLLDYHVPVTQVVAGNFKGKLQGILKLQFF